MIDTLCVGLILAALLAGYGIARLLDHLPPATRPEVVAALHITYPTLDLTLQPRLASLSSSGAFAAPPAPRPSGTPTCTPRFGCGCSCCC